MTEQYKFDTNFKKYLKYLNCFLEKLNYIQLYYTYLYAYTRIKCIIVIDLETHKQNCFDRSSFSKINLFYSKLQV